MKKILITGASGFIGSFLVEEALKKNYKVFAGVRNTSSRTYLDDNRLHFLELDFSNPENLKKKLSAFKEQHGNFDFIIHGAGVTKVKHPDDFFKINEQFTKNFVDALIKTDSIPQKFLFISSLAAFGPGKEKEQISHTHIPNPITSYGQSKLNVEKYLGSLSGFPHIIIRPPGVYGPRDKEFYLLYKVIKQGIEPYLGSRNQRLSFIYVSDLANAMMKALESSVTNKAYFVSDGFEYTIQSFNETIKKHLGKKTVKIIVPTALVKPIAWSMEKFSALFGTVATFNRERVKEFEAANWLCNIEPIKKDLNFSAQYNLESGMKESIAWYKKNGWL